jgi:hypothetical protein
MKFEKGKFYRYSNLPDKYEFISTDNTGANWFLIPNGNICSYTHGQHFSEWVEPKTIVFNASIIVDKYGVVHTPKHFFARIRFTNITLEEGATYEATLTKVKP